MKKQYDYQWYSQIFNWGKCRGIFIKYKKIYLLWVLSFRLHQQQWVWISILPTRLLSTSIFFARTPFLKVFNVYFIPNDLSTQLMNNIYGISIISKYYEFLGKLTIVLCLDWSEQQPWVNNQWVWSRLWFMLDRLQFIFEQFVDKAYRFRTKNKVK